MAKTLFLFLFSSRPDPYINAMAYAFDRMAIGAVKLIYIKGVTTGLSDSQAVITANQIWNRLQDLTDLGDIYHRMNERVLDRQLVALTYSTLAQDLGKQVKLAGGNTNCILDLTGAAKAPSIDIFAVCLALGVNSVYVFELYQKIDPTALEKSLYHMLEPAAYSYRCLSDTQPVQASRSALLRKTPVLWFVAAFALAVLVLSITLLLITGSDSTALQILNLSAAIVGLASPLLALFHEHRA